MATFFIVDDEPILHELYRDILKLKGHEVIGQAYNGEDCLEKLIKMEHSRNNGPDFIIMDHRMPVTNGLEATRELMQKEPGHKIIFISADISVKDKALSAGSVAFIKKPFNLDTFFTYIDKLLEGLEKKY